MPIGILTALWSWLSSKITFKGVVIFLALCVLAYGGYKGYEHILDKGKALGVASVQPQLDKLQKQITQDKKDIATVEKERDLAKADLASYVKSYNDYVAKQKAINDQLKKDQDAVVAGLNKKIGTLNGQLAQAQKELTHAIPTLVPVGTPDVSRGLIVLYNTAITTGADPTGGFASARGVGSDASYAPGVPASTAARFFIDNGLACVRNRETLILWQDWYKGNKAAIDSAIQPQKTMVAPSTDSSGKMGQNPAGGLKGDSLSPESVQPKPAVPPTDTAPVKL